MVYSGSKYIVNWQDKWGINVGYAHPSSKKEVEEVERGEGEEGQRR